LRVGLRGDQARGVDQGMVELLNRTHGDQAGALGERFGADIKNGKAGELERASDFAEKGRFLPWLSMRVSCIWWPILERQAGKAGSAAEVEDVRAGVAGEERAGGEERLAEVTDDHLLGRAQGGEIHALIPAGEQIEMDGDGGQQGVIEFGGGTKGASKSRRAEASMVNRINQGSSEALAGVRKLGSRGTRCGPGWNSEPHFDGTVRAS